MEDLSITLVNGEISYTCPIQEINCFYISLVLGTSLDIMISDKENNSHLIASDEKIRIANSNVEILVDDKLRGPILRLSQRLSELSLYQLLDYLRYVRKHYAFSATQEHYFVENPYEAYLVNHYVNFVGGPEPVVTGTEIHESSDLYFLDLKRGDRHYIRSVFPGILTLDLVERILRSYPFFRAKISKTGSCLEVEFEKPVPLSYLALDIVSAFNRYI